MSRERRARRAGGSSGDSTSAQGRERTGGKGNTAARVYKDVRPKPSGTTQASNESAQPGASVDAQLTVTARRDGEVVAEWTGSIAWTGALPSKVTATWAQDRWSWSDNDPAKQVCIDAAIRNQCGKDALSWAREHGATELVVSVAHKPKQVRDDASTDGRGTEGQGTGADDAQLGEWTSAALRGESANGHEHGLDGGSEHGSVDGFEDGTAGRGQRGTGTATGKAGDGNERGTGTEQGKSGVADGSTRPSWALNPTAEIDNENGGIAPGPDGKKDGSAAGEKGRTGHALGWAWFGGPIDVPKDIAPLVVAGMIIVEADLAGFSQKWLGKVVRGMKAVDLRKELQAEARRIARARRPEVEARLKETPEYAALSRADIEAALERGYYEKAREHFARQVQDNERAMLRFREAGDTHNATIAAENARAYRTMEETAADLAGTRPAARGATDASPDAVRAAHLAEETQALGHASAWPDHAPLSRADADDALRALGTGPERDALKTTHARGAGAVKEAGERLTNQHHVLPQQYRTRFEKEYGFTGKHDIDNYCIVLDEVEHQVTHGGGSFKRARQAWPEQEWNTALIKELDRRERAFNRKLTRDEVLEVARDLLNIRGLGDRPFVRYTNRKSSKSGRKVSP